MKILYSSLKWGIWWVIFGLLSGSLMACGEDPQQLFETAQFEEQQHNRAHAQELYERIIQLHPDGELAQKARKRLEELVKENQGREN